MEDVGNIPVIENNNAVVSLEDLVKLKRTFKDKKSIANVNGERAVSVTVFKKSDAREVVVAQKVNVIVDEAKNFFQMEWK
jgi:multidrug efflux pump